MSGVDECHACICEHPRDQLTVCGEIAGIGVHEHERWFALRLRTRELFGDAISVVHRQPEVRPSSASRNNVDEDAPVTCDHLDLWSLRSVERCVELSKVAGLEVMIAGHDAIWQSQAR
ncbi:MAG: hypothetical protein QM831_11790 [Kofleriaceae bacterium]